MSQQVIQSSKRSAVQQVMSLTQRDAAALDAMTAAGATVRVPQLAAAGGAGGAHYAAWRPQMQTILMRAGLDERDYAKEIPQWKELAAAVQADAQAADDEAVALLLGRPTAPSSAAAVAAPTEHEKTHTRAKERVA